MAQLNVLEAIYHVPGEYAKVVEAQLVRRFQMAPLRFLCCGWESAGNAAVFVDAKGYRYEIRMTSGETLEKDWKKIPIFTVSVSKLLENP